jgi:hypothetical protein
LSPSRAIDDSEKETPALLQLAGLSFREAVTEALLNRDEAASEATSPIPSQTTEAPLAASTSQGEACGLPVREAALIAREADRTGVNPSLLVALRRAENGGPGREFGVRSVPATGLEAQARVAANTIRNNIERFEREGGRAVDPASGRYTDDFLRFLSSRYAPVGAENDPTGLNRFHATNLIAFYRKASRSDG